MNVYKQGAGLTGLAPAGFLRAVNARFQGVEGADVIRIDGGSLQGPWVTGVWGVEPCEFDLEYKTSELATLLEGRVQLTADGRTHELKAGDSFFVPKGQTVRWKVLEPLRKCFLIVPA